MIKRKKISLTVNGEVRVGMAEPRMLLSNFIRDELRLTGTHVGCEHGVCGACTVIFNGQAARSCLMFAIQAEDAEIKTIEGLATNNKMHCLQELFAKHRALQCGFCTPGMIMRGKELLEKNPNPTEEEIRWGISGNLCRCTGYSNIIKSIQYAANKLNEKQEEAA